MKFLVFFQASLLFAIAAIAAENPSPSPAGTPAVEARPSAAPKEHLATE